MTREKLNFSKERDVVTNLITSDKFCKQLSSFIQISYFDSDYSKIIVEWVLDYFKKYNEAPKQNIMSIYKSRCSEISDSSVRDSVLVYIRKIDENYDSVKPNNEEYSIDQGLKFITEKSLREFHENLGACLDVGDLDKASELRNNYRQVVTQTDDEITFIEGDTESAYNALTEVQEEIVDIPEPFERVIGKLHRNDFIAVGGRAKAGKSWFLLWLALQCASQGLKVVYFTLEMTANEVFNRLWLMAFGKKSGVVEVGKKFESSRFIEPEDEDGKYTIEEYETSVDESVDIDVEKKRQMLKVMFHGGDIRIIGYPMNQASMTKIKDKIDDLISDGFVPDVIDIDYLDITKMSGFNGELRNQLDYTWKTARGWAKELHSLVVTGTQLNRGAFGKGHVSADQVAEDVRKLGHCTSMFALDQTPAMKKKHLMALMPFVARSSETDVNGCVFCQNLNYGQFLNGKPHMMNEVDFSEDEDD